MPRSTLRFLTPIAVPAWVALVLVGCGGPADPPPATSSDPGETAGEDPSAAANEPERTTIAMSREVSTLDPHLHDEASAYSLLGNVYEGLVALDAEMEVVPALAESWETVDDTTWRFRLREGAVFHDGAPVEAEDVRASLERAMHHPQSKASGYVISVAESRVVDPLTLEIVTVGPSPVLLRKLVSVHVVPRSAPETITEPVGSGPYRFESYEPGEWVDLAAHAEHWGGPPALDRVRFTFVGSSRTRVDQLLEGEAQVIQEVGVQELPRVAYEREVEVKSRPGIKVTYLNLLVTEKPFDDLRVRRALHLAIDRQSLVATMRAGEGIPAGQMVSPEIHGFVPGLEPPARDLEAARRLLTEAGYRNGLDLDLEYREGMRPEPLIEQLAEAGIRVTAKPQPWAELYPRLIAGEVRLYLGSWGCESGDASSLFDHKAHTKDPEAGYGSSNSMGYSNPELDAVIEATNTLDEKERLRLLQQGMRILMKDLPVVPLFVPAAIYASSTDLQWTPRLDGSMHAVDLRPKGAPAGSGPTP